MDVESPRTVNTHPYMYECVKLTIYSKTSKPLAKNAHTCEFNSSLLPSYFNGCGGCKLQEVTVTTNVLYDMTLQLLNMFWCLALCCIWDGEIFRLVVRDNVASHNEDKVHKFPWGLQKHCRFYMKYISPSILLLSYHLIHLHEELRWW